MAEPAIPNPIKSSNLQTGLTPKASSGPKKPPQQKQVSSTQIIQQSVAKEQPGADVNRIMQTIAYMMQRKMVQTSGLARGSLPLRHRTSNVPKGLVCFAPDVFGSLVFRRAAKNRTAWTISETRSGE